MSSQCVAPSRRYELLSTSSLCVAWHRCADDWLNILLGPLLLHHEMVINAFETAPWLLVSNAIGTWKRHWSAKRWKTHGPNFISRLGTMFELWVHKCVIRWERLHKGRVVMAGFKTFRLALKYVSAHHTQVVDRPVDLARFSQLCVGFKNSYAKPVMPLPISRLMEM